VINANGLVEESDTLVSATNAREPVYFTNLKNVLHVKAKGLFR